MFKRVVIYSSGCLRCFYSLVCSGGESHIIFSVCLRPPCLPPRCHTNALSMLKISENAPYCVQ